jgi:hypothetical protein
MPILEVKCELYKEGYEKMSCGQARRNECFDCPHNLNSCYRSNVDANTRFAR